MSERRNFERVPSPGLCLLYKRLHEAVFEMPRGDEQQGSVRIDAVALARLLAGAPKAARARK